MNETLKQILETIQYEYRHIAQAGGRHYLNVNIGRIAAKLGIDSLKECYKNQEVIVALKGPQPGMKVRIDGRTFIHYAEYSDGFAVPEYIARHSGLPFKKYNARDSMILNMTT